MKKSCAIVIILSYIFNNDLLVKGQELCKIYYLENNFEENLIFDEYVILGDFMDEYKIKLVLETFLYNSKKNIFCQKSLCKFCYCLIFCKSFCFFSICFLLVKIYISLNNFSILG